jgi:hypothetical protein
VVFFRSCHVEAPRRPRGVHLDPRRLERPLVLKFVHVPCGPSLVVGFSIGRWAQIGVWARSEGECFFLSNYFMTLN